MCFRECCLWIGINWMMVRKGNCWRIMVGGAGTPLILWECCSDAQEAYTYAGFVNMPQLK